MDRLNECIFKLKMMSYWKNIKLFGLKSALISKKNLIASLSAIPIYNTCLHGDKVTNFSDKEILRQTLIILV